MWWSSLLTKGLSFLSGWGGYVLLALAVAASTGWTTYTICEQIYNGRIAVIQRDYAEEVNKINAQTAEGMKTIAEAIGIEEGVLAENLKDSNELSRQIEEELKLRENEKASSLSPAASRALNRLRNSQRRPN